MTIAVGDWVVRKPESQRGHWTQGARPYRVSGVGGPWIALEDGDTPRVLVWDGRLFDVVDLSTSTGASTGVDLAMALQLADLCQRSAPAAARWLRRQVADVLSRCLLNIPQQWESVS